MIRHCRAPECRRELLPTEAGPYCTVCSQWVYAVALDPREARGDPPVFLAEDEDELRGMVGGTLARQCQSCGATEIRTVRGVAVAVVEEDEVPEGPALEIRSAPASSTGVEVRCLACGSTFPVRSYQAWEVEF